MKTGFGVKRFDCFFLIGCVLAILVEGAVVLLDRTAPFRIEGKESYDVTELGSGGVVSHSFLMRGDGLRGVRVRLSARAPVSVTMRWTVWRGTLDAPPYMTLAAEGTERIDLRAGRRWHTLPVTRDASSNDRWYTVQVQLVEALPDPIAAVRIVASRDNPYRGGVFWVNGIRQPGSLNLRAERRGRTLYRRFLVEAAPNLPRALQLPAVQWTIFVAFHWAMIVFAYAVLREGHQRGSETPAAAIERVS